MDPGLRKLVSASCWSIAMGTFHTRGEESVVRVLLVNCESGSLGAVGLLLDTLTVVCS